MDNKDDLKRTKDSWFRRVYGCEAVSILALSVSGFVKKVCVKDSLQEGFYCLDAPFYCRGTVMRKCATLLLVTVLAASSLVMVEFACAQVGVTTPIIPGFGLMYEPHKYYVAPTYSVDPATGKAVMTHEGYYKINRYVHLSISNQPFEPYTDSEGNPIDLYYSIRWKPHNEASWQTLLQPPFRFSQNKDFYLTAINIGFKGNADHSDWHIDILDYVPESQIDFQIQASIGYYEENNVFVGKTTGWSKTQTLTVPEDQLQTSSPSTTPTTNPKQQLTPTPSQQPTENQETIIGAAITVAVISAGLGLLIYLIKRK